MNYPTSVLKSANNRLVQIRKRNKELSSQKKSLVYSKIPEIYSCNEEIASILKSILIQNVDTETLKKRVKALAEKRTVLLLENGFDKDAMEDVYSCPICRDDGFYEGKVCSCYEKIILEEAYKLSNLEEKIKYQNFEKADFSVFSKPEEMKKIYNRAYNFCNDKNEGKNNLFFIGNPGTGKTFLSSCIAKSFLDSRKSVLYLSAVRLSDILDDSKFKKGNDSQQEAISDCIDFIHSCDLLIIDDLGTEFSLPYSQSQMFDILDARISNKKRNIISTNLALQELATKYSSRFTSRIVESCDVIFFGEDDIRIKNSIS